MLTTSQIDSPPRSSVLEVPSLIEAIAFSNIDTVWVLRAVAELFDTWAVADHVRLEEVMSTGMTVGKSPHPRVDAAVIGWLAPEPPAAHVAILAWFLFGYWSHAAEVSRDVCLRLAAELSRVPQTSTAYLGILLALQSAEASASQMAVADRTWIRRLLLEHEPRLEGAYARGRAGIAGTAAAPPRPS